jgi:hypothetical protein
MVWPIALNKILNCGLLHRNKLCAVTRVLNLLDTVGTNQTLLDTELFNTKLLRCKEGVACFIAAHAWWGGGGMVGHLRRGGGHLGQVDSL